MEGVCASLCGCVCDVSERFGENLCVFVLNVADKGCGAATERTHTNRGN